MSRQTTAAVDAAINAGHVQLFYLLEMEFRSGTIYLTNLGFNVTWNGQEYTGAGAVGAVEEIRESAAAEATGLKFTLSGVPSEMVAIALGEHVQGRWARLYTAFWANGAIVADPVLEWAGLVDTLAISDGAESATIQVSVESRVVSFKRPNVRRYNNADQQSQYPGDRFFEYVEEMAEKPLVWPSREFWK
ncbi:hypothetical protein [Pigmentiphaga daeguensis]|uniref:DUF2163 domain-containing protein n=1 Tax=Pigmentiphaga daeguensis TaxID=414049 RepID=A0ABP3L5L3_9BURK